MKSGRTIMVVEDDPVMNELLKDELERMGHRVLDAEDGLEALIALETFRPDIIITDLMMPNMDGYELIRTVRQSETHRHVPIVAMSASGGLQTRERAIARGANEFMPKPFSFTKLEWCLERHLPPRKGSEETVTFA